MNPVGGYQLWPQGTTSVSLCAKTATGGAPILNTGDASSRTLTVYADQYACLDYSLFDVFDTVPTLTNGYKRVGTYNEFKGWPLPGTKTDFGAAIH